MDEPWEGARSTISVCVVFMTQMIVKPTANFQSTTQPGQQNLGLTNDLQNKGCCQVHVLLKAPSITHCGDNEYEEVIWHRPESGTFDWEILLLRNVFRSHAILTVRFGLAYHLLLDRLIIPIKELPNEQTAKAHSTAYC